MMGPTGPMFFNDLLKNQFMAVNEEGKGEKIAANLENRVVTFLQSCDKDKSFLSKNRDSGNALIDQYSDFGGLVDQVKLVAENFRRSIFQTKLTSFYNCSVEISSFPVEPV